LVRASFISWQGEPGFGSGREVRAADGSASVITVVRRDRVRRELVLVRPGSTSSRWRPNRKAHFGVIGVETGADSP